MNATARPPDALADVDAGRVINHQAVQTWADSLRTDTALPVLIIRPPDYRPADPEWQRLLRRSRWDGSYLSPRTDRYVLNFHNLGILKVCLADAYEAKAYGIAESASDQIMPTLGFVHSHGHGVPYCLWFFCLAQTYLSCLLIP